MDIESRKKLDTLHAAHVNRTALSALHHLSTIVAIGAALVAVFHR